MQFYEINVCRVMIFNLHAVYKKRDNEGNWLSNQKIIASIIASTQKILLPSIRVAFEVFRMSVFRTLYTLFVAHIRDVNRKVLKSSILIILYAHM